MAARLALTFVIATALTAYALLLLQHYAPRWGLIDRPRGRKRHLQPTPATGGLAMAFGVAAVAWLRSPEMSNAVLGYLLGAAILIAVSALDDIYDLRWWYRLGAQVAAALIMIYIGQVRIDNLGGLFGYSPAALGVLSVPLTVIATVGVINAINMADGADGLAGSLALVALAMLGAAAFYIGNLRLFELLVPFVGALIAFLWFNMRLPWRHRAQVFMGNAGSAFLGFTIIFAVFRLTQNPQYTVSPVLAPWLLAPPIVDCLVLIVRRLKMGRSPFHADRGHMHHLLQDAGFSAGQIALLLAGLSLCLGLAAATALKARLPEYWLVIAFVVMTVAYYWLTAKRERALRIFRQLHQALHGKPAAGGAGKVADF